jgi:G3E family GTPase
MSFSSCVSCNVRPTADFTITMRQNKWEHVSEQALDIVLDHLNTLNDLTPKIKCKGRGGVDPNLVFGLETTLFTENESQANHPAVLSHNDEVETVTLQKGSAYIRNQRKPHEHIGDQCGCAQDTPEDMGTDGEGSLGDLSEAIEKEILQNALNQISKESIWRVKGFIRLKSGSDSAQSQVYILNWAFGRHDLTLFLSESGLTELEVIKLTVMGERGEVRRAICRFCESLSAQIL